MNKLMIAAALGATLFTSNAFAAQDQPRRDPLGRADANGDGIVTREEMIADSDARFAKLDTNKDGKLSADELNGGMGGRMMGRADANGDGFVTLDELHAQVNRRFDLVDANKDGKLDQAERDKARQAMMSRGGGN